MGTYLGRLEPGHRGEGYHSSPDKAVVLRSEQPEEVINMIRNQGWVAVSDLVQHLEAVGLDVPVFVMEGISDFLDSSPILGGDELDCEFLVGNLVSTALEEGDFLENGARLRHWSTLPPFDQFTERETQCSEPNQGSLDAEFTRRVEAATRKQPLATPNGRTPSGCLAGARSQGGEAVKSSAPCGGVWSPCRQALVLQPSIDFSMACSHRDTGPFVPAVHYTPPTASSRGFVHAQRDPRDDVMDPVALQLVAANQIEAGVQVVDPVVHFLQRHMLFVERLG